MTVEELLVLLAKENPKAVVGACHASIHGWVNTFKGVKHGEDGSVVLDLCEETTTDEEISIK